MKIHAVILLSIVCIGSTVCLAAAENPNVNTSFRSTTTVPSQNQRRRLLTSPNPLEAGGNNVVTGTVGGLRYFHGVVPYGSRYYSGVGAADTGSSSVSSFLRRSTDPILSDRNPGQTRAYYEPRRTVSSFHVQNGQRTALSQTTPRSRSRQSTIFLPNLLDEPASTATQQRPLSSSRQDLDEILSRQFELKAQAKETARRTVLDTQDKFKNFFEIVLEPEDYTREGLEEPVTDQILQEPAEPLPDERRARPLEPAERRDEDPTEPDIPLTVEDVPTRDDFLEQADEEEPADGQEPQPDEMETLIDEAGQRSELHAEAERIRGQHETTESLARSRFSNYMRAAEELIRSGKFYQAADAYSLAAIWNSNDPRPYAGQAFALFAAGEYMSSAYYLSRAIEIDPAIAVKQYDLAALIGDRDVFENRLIEMTTWQQRSGSGELALLMAYVLHHDGKSAQAAEAIRTAETRMPDSRAVAILKDVIIPENRTP